MEFVCIHCNADEHVQKYKIMPAFEACESFTGKQEKINNEKIECESVCFKENTPNRKAFFE